MSLPLGCLLLASASLAQTTNWVQINTTNNPGPRWSHGNAFDPLRNRTVCFGGGSSTIKGDDTWLYDGNDWTQVQPATKPPGRRLTAMVFHFAKLHTLLFGGSGTANLNDTWAWDGTNWTQLTPTNSPSPRWGHGMAYDSTRHRTVLIGGLGTTLYNDTWEWDGNDWTQIQTQNAPPVGIFGGSIAYDSARKKVVFFGGRTGSTYLADTWEYDGKDWTKASPTQSPPGRYYVAMDYDVARKRIVMFGGLDGNGLVGETWEYDGTTWTQANTAASPPGRRDYDQMVYDSIRQKIVIYGGTTTNGLGADTWEYGESSLTATPSTISVATGGKHSFTLDAGAAHANRYYWILGSVSGTTPGVNLGSVNLPLNWDWYTDVTLAFANTALFPTSFSTLDANGKGTAAFNVPMLPASAIGVKFYHAYVVIDLQLKFYMASNPVVLTMVQ